MILVYSIRGHNYIYIYTTRPTLLNLSSLQKVRVYGLKYDLQPLHGSQGPVKAANNPMAISSPWSSLVLNKFHKKVCQTVFVVMKWLILMYSRRVVIGFLPQRLHTIYYY